MILALLAIACLLLAGAVAVLVSRERAEPRLAARFDGFDRALDRVEHALRDEVRSGRRDAEESIQRLSASLVQAQAALGDAQARQLHALAAEVGASRQQVDLKVEALRAGLERCLTDVRQETAGHLDRIRQAVDEKLESTLEKRLGDSFRQVSERLEQVYKGLGEMQMLASGVGELKRVLVNVKTRGTWGEVQLGMLLEQVLAPDQYERNVATSAGSGERVEFAIRLPGRHGSTDRPMWLPIDAKFPLEDYQSLVEASERMDAVAMEEASRRLEARIKVCARDISTKYINPPETTDFAVMFLPNEGLYAEVLRRPGLADTVQREHRVVIAGPMTLWAILNSLQMGFRTLAIEHRSSEVWTLLGAVKTEFAKFGGALDAIQQNLNRASSKIDAARKGTRAIERRLTDVQELPAADAAVLLDDLLVGTPEPEESLTG